MEHFETVKEVQDCLENLKVLVSNKVMMSENGYFIFPNKYERDIFIVFNNNIKEKVEEFEDMVHPHMNLEAFETKFKEEIVPLCINAKSIKYRTRG